MRPQALDGEVHHVGLHQTQDTEDFPERIREITVSFTSLLIHGRRLPQLISLSLHDNCSTFVNFSNPELKSGAELRVIHKMHSRCIEQIT